jgi:hypothetical protein
MNDNDTFESYEDDFDTDFDSGVPEGNDEVIDARTETSSVNDRVTDLLLGGSGDLGEGETPTKGRDFQTRDLDAHGRIDHGDTKQEAPQQQETSQTIRAGAVSQAQQEALNTWNEAHKNNERLDEMLRNGEIDQKTHYEASFQLGQIAANAKEQLYMSRIAELEHSNQLHGEYRKLESLGEDWSPENRKATMKGIVDFALQRGIDPETLAGVESASEAEFLYRAWKDSETAERQRLELASLKQRNRELTRQMKGRQRKAQKSSQLGTRSGTEQTIEQVMDILANAGAPKGGRR